ncbi:HD-GYP domain-containing protein [Bacillus marinisedimentorum]|uniref:HD-GYP domain-containing protein n=1 Tax=Bacillus marinisedimentorum TaxID=1821260 RepID=UPI0012FFB204|nr:HD-GYP domain-containing protein [Bacillus marinisedimentorum]
MKVLVSQLKEGCILSEDINLKGTQPFMRKKTVLTARHLEVLRAFLIREVTIEPLLASGEYFKGGKEDEEHQKQEQSRKPSSSGINMSEEPFLNTYLKAVRQFKAMYKTWEAGAQIDIVKVREVLIPLFTVSETAGNEVFHLHHYSTPDDYLYHHSVATGLISSFLARKLNYAKADMLNIGLAGALSDIGMIKLPIRTINKPGLLTEQEYEKVKQHPILSYKMIRSLNLLPESVKLAVLQHHERLDGSGYPMGSSGLKIHIYSRIISLADVYHAMTTERVYHQKQSPFRAIEAIRKEHFGQFDPEVMQLLQKSIITFSPGTEVKLSNSEKGNIMYIDQVNPTRPIIKLSGSGELMKLADHPELYIDEVI